MSNERHLAELGALHERIDELEAQVRHWKRIAVAPSWGMPATTCESGCNPYTAPCGAKFCTYEESVQHTREHAVPPPPPHLDALAAGLSARYYYDGAHHILQDSADTPQS